MSRSSSHVSDGSSPAHTMRARAPVRLDLAGGWTDVPPFCDREGGAVVNLTINRYCYVTVRRQERGYTLQSADYGARAEVARLDDVPAGSGLELLAASILLARDAAGGPAAEPAGGMELFVRCDAPPGSGTGSSATVGVALAGALAAFAGTPLAAHEAALRAIRAEREYLRNAGGTQDQFAAAHGGASYMVFPAVSPSDDPTGSPGGSAAGGQPPDGPPARVSPLRLQPGTVAELEKRLVLAYTGVSRVSGSIIDSVMGAYQAGAPQTVDALRTMRRLAADVKTALLAGDVESLGAALAENWRCQKALHPSVTNAGLDTLYETALAAGALGGKALGAGGGGCVLFLAAADREHELAAALSAAGAQVLDFTLDWNGLQVWQPAPADGASKV